jgi:hypothetical protein
MSTICFSDALVKRMPNTENDARPIPGESDRSM